MLLESLRVVKTSSALVESYRYPIFFISSRLADLSGIQFYLFYSYSLCHPGPCPHCPAMVNRRCKCGKTSHRVRCFQTKEVECKKPCMKRRNCFIHVCKDICHPSPCDKCDVIVDQGDMTSPYVIAINHFPVKNTITHSDTY